MTKQELINDIRGAVSRFIGHCDNSFSSYSKDRLLRVYERAQQLDQLTMEIELYEVHFFDLSPMELMQIDFGMDHPVKHYRDSQFALKCQRQQIWDNGFFA